MDLPKLNSKLSNSRDIELNNLPRLNINELILRSTDKNLKILDLSDNGLEEFPIEITNLTFLRELNLSNNRLKEIPCEIAKLENLEVLNLSTNGLKKFPHALTELKNLNTLYFASNQIEKIPDKISSLSNLKNLDLSGNNLKEMPNGTRNLQSLINLYLHDNKFEKFPNEVLELKKLSLLILSANKLKDIPYEIVKLNNLVGLILDKNKLTKFPIEVIGLNSLKMLSLKGNFIDKLPTEIKQLKLDDLYLQSNLLKEIPVEITEIEGLKSIGLSGNLIEEPPLEVCLRGIKTIRNYYKEIASKEAIKLYESKLLIVGNGEVGKTTLMKKLKDNNYEVKVGEEPTTHGINIVPLELGCNFQSGTLQNVKINIWDFGGQEIYHATHQFFLTKRSLYLFVWEARKEEDYNSFDYWLNVIKLLSDNSPVIMVMNKADVRIKYIDEASIQDKFPNIKYFRHISCMNGQGLYELMENIKSSLSEIPHMGDKLPKVWLDIRDKLKSLNKNYISRANYLEICEKYNLNEERAEFISDYLHNLGTILHFKDDSKLENIVILEPEWATNAFYHLIDTSSVRANRGRFDLQDLKLIWDQSLYPREKHRELIRLMEKFELCFNLVDTDIYIVPELLPAQRPKIDFNEFIKPKNLRFEYHYEFMPAGIISRFISRVYYLILGENYWKNGVLLELENSKALVMSDQLSRKIKVFVMGSYKNELLAIINNEIDHIHRTLNLIKNENYKEMIPCNCDKCVSSNDPHLYEYNVLKKFSDKGTNEIPCQKSIEWVSIQTLLKGFEYKFPESYTEEDILKNLISVCSRLQGIVKCVHSDEDSRNTIFTGLLESRGIIAKDQTRWGQSATGISCGELDFKIQDTKGRPIAVCEAFNLKLLDKKRINDHLTKLFGYDPNGLKQNFILVYSEANKFINLWEKYLFHIRGMNFKYPILNVEDISDKISEFAEIKIALSTHQRNVNITKIYHIFMNMNV
jgi:small GTP-binding protein domain